MKAALTIVSIMVASLALIGSIFIAGCNTNANPTKTFSNATSAKVFKNVSSVKTTMCPNCGKNCCEGKKRVAKITNKEK